MKDIDFLRQYLDAARESSTRTRQILLLMIIASILVFSAYWNSRTGGWMNNRLDQAVKEVDYFRTKERQTSEGLAKSIDSETPPVEERNRQAEKLSLRGDQLRAEDRLNWLQKIRAEQVGQIQVPVIGISFDVNDLGMLGGFAFVVLLIWVNYSLWHHSTNLRLAFDFARDLQKKNEPRLLYYTYQNLAMRQVLTIPPRPASDRTPEKDKIKLWIQNISKLLYALPLAVHTTVFLHDLSTIDIGKSISDTATKNVIITGAIFLFLILLLTIVCFFIWTRTYKTWETVADEV